MYTFSHVNLNTPATSNYVNALKFSGSYVMNDTDIRDWCKPGELRNLQRHYFLFIISICM